MIIKPGNPGLFLFLAVAGLGQAISNTLLGGVYMAVRNRLKEIRMKEYMMTQKEFAGFLEMDYSMYNRIENNMKQVTLETALKISNKLNKTVNEIFELV